MVDVLSSFVAAGVSGAAEKLIESFILFGKKRYANIIKTNFTDHLNNTFNKCIKIKTLLNRDKATDLLEIYTNQNFKLQDEKLDTYDLVDNIKNNAVAYVLTGTGGGGKSMFMRYLWLSLYEDPRGRIPIFIELRNFDNKCHESMEDFIYQAVLNAGSTLTKHDFNQSLKAGDYVLVLDGFDEVATNMCQQLQSYIIAIQENNPNITIIVSSRPSERFNGWHLFQTVEILPLNKSQVRDLIKKAPFNKDIKESFLKKLDSFYQTHKSFLETPLLASMMLISFGYNQNLPDKMVEFYNAVFDALFFRHDQMKNGYQRQYHSRLDSLEFKKLISQISLRSYLDQKIDFSREDLEKLIDQAKNAMSLDESVDNIFKDLLESLCIFKQDGLNFSFSHRSFQEYFAAFCLDWYDCDVLQIVKKISERYSDNVLLMFYQIAPQKFRNKIIQPLYNGNLDFFKHYNYTLEVALKYYAHKITLMIHRDSARNSIVLGMIYIAQKENYLLYIYLQISKYYFNFCHFNYEELNKDFLKKNPNFFKENFIEISLINDKVCLDNLQLIEVYDCDNIFVDFKQSAFYQYLIAIFDRQYQFFTDEYEKAKQEDAYKLL